MTIHDIPIGEIDLESPDFAEFLFSYRPAIENLAASIAGVGLIHPVILLRQDNRTQFRLISGYRRVLACRKIGKPSVAARVLEERETGKEETLLLSLHENIHSRGLHDLEKAVALKKFQRVLDWSEEKIVSKLLPILSLPPSVDTLQNYLSLNFLIDEIQLLLYEGALTTGQGFLLARLDEDEQRTLSRLVLTRCSLNLNELKEVIRNLTDLRDRRGSSFEKILADESFPPAFRDEEATLRARTQALRSGLRVLRYPRIDQKEQAFSAAVKELHLGNEVSVRSAPFFEADELRIQIVARNTDHLQEILRKFSEGCENGKVGEIFRIIRE